MYVNVTFFMDSERSMAKRLRQIAAVLLTGIVLVGCSDEQASAPGAPPPGAVKIVTVKQEELPITNELPGRIAPTRLAEVRPRVSGIIVERVFEQGSLVQEGDVLYRIDPAPFQVRVDSAEGTLRRAQAAQLQARQTADRQQQLRRSNVGSQQEFDNAIAQLAQADAEVAVAEAGVAEAKLNLQYADVKAPIGGRIGRARITEGALVSATGSENLATIQQLDPIYADFTQPAADLIRLRKALQDGKLMTGSNEAEVNLLFDDGSRYPVPGRLLFSEAAVDETTGQVTLRGEFPNPNGDLLPGMYVRVQIQQGIQKAAFAVPQQAVQRDAGGQASVLVVNAEDTVEQRRVSVGRSVGDRWVISEGLKDGDRVVAEGFQKTAPGAKVKPEPWSDEADVATAAGSESAAPAAKQ
ncbi:efflux RND transporter periplasmic adaptor subunit [Agrobacterium tumefaciens]|jgi:membrane fusion protein (multidrug efflux system)|uniref:Efflux RND transporter periplasmic adaptor subunit n=2 Tax=Agrobacterium tumefaciens complex TaxID=1183400 RepID=A0AAP9E643_AGRTU|nr:efflux RND transporter periplasmic adaptor subunit [Agrobacterium tumefaciens]QDY95721.2 efflux RND transporter periplasmic adaptor subunit [Agrobacterium tumefaciens]UXS45952.1 efflux RND transporter periplasmic adaptor subunit [Agrobacterium tumefaciens]UXS73466.1 efflux RND transporter periplasmic adaptor subunit [Agrobacterium tumefaciens]UXS79699.1 efflux RND transporter periplasmic adaptor subunit [Agrobacterium tumefaciens]